MTRLRRRCRLRLIGYPKIMTIKHFTVSKWHQIFTVIKNTPGTTTEDSEGFSVNEMFFPEEE